MNRARPGDGAMLQLFLREGSFLIRGMASISHEWQAMLNRSGKRSAIVIPPLVKTIVSECIALIAS